MDIQNFVNKATELYKAGKQSEALQLYNQAFEALVDEASAYSSKKPETHRDEHTTKGEKVYTVLPKYFDETKKISKKRQYSLYYIEKYGRNLQRSW